MFQWLTYDQTLSLLVNSWLDEDAVAFTGIEDGWDNYWLAVKEDSVNFPGCKDYCRVVFDGSVSFAAICFGVFQHTMTISEVVVAPGFRGMGLGTRLLSELIHMTKSGNFGEVSQITAVIFPQNFGSQKAFQRAGFSQAGYTEDGIDLIYTYLL